MQMLNQLVIGVMPLIPKAIVGRIACRYIAGDSKEEAIELLHGLARKKFCTTIDHLGEDITTIEEAAQTSRD